MCSRQMPVLPTLTRTINGHPFKIFEFLVLFYIDALNTDVSPSSVLPSLVVVCMTSNILIFTQALHRSTRAIASKSSPCSISIFSQSHPHLVPRIFRFPSPPPHKPSQGSQRRLGGIQCFEPVTFVEDHTARSPAIRSRSPSWGAGGSRGSECGVVSVELSIAILLE